MSIQVNDFQWEPGKNDAEYIKLLESSRDEWQKIAQKAIAKLKALSKAQEPRVMTVDEMNQLSNGDTVWVEISDGRLLPMMVEDGTLMRWGYMWRICDEAFCAHEEGECAARAWTSRPTDEQREAEPWN